MPGVVFYAWDTKIKKKRHSCSLQTTHKFRGKIDNIHYHIIVGTKTVIKGFTTTEKEATCSHLRKSRKVLPKG